MAIRELFAKFEFAWDHRTLAKVIEASKKAEKEIEKVGISFDEVLKRAKKASPPLGVWASKLRQVGTAATSTSSKLRMPRARAGLERVHAVSDKVAAKLRQVGTAATSTTFKLRMPRARAGLERVRDVSGKVVVKLRQVGQRWRTAFRGGGAEKATGGLKELLGTLGVLGGAIGAAFAGRALIRGVADTLAFVDAQAKMAAQLAISTEALQTLDAAAHMSGFSVEDLRVGVTSMTRNLGIFAATGKGRSVAILKEMGMGIDDIKDKDPAELFWSFGKAFAAMEDPVRRSAFAQQVFGESGSKMLSLFKGAPADIDAVRKKSTELGVLFSGKFAKGIEATRDQLYLAGLQFKRIQIQMVGHLAPALTWIASKLIAVGQAFHSLTESNHSLQAGFASAGWMAFRALLAKLTGGMGGLRGAVARLWPILLRMGRILLPWIAWTLILDDVITFLKGGESALGRFLDGIFGAGSATIVLEGLKAAWAAILQEIKWVGRGLRSVFGDMGPRTRTATALVAAFALIASTGLGQMLFKLGLLAKAWLLQIARIGATAAAWAAAQVSAIALTGSLGAMAVAAGAVAAAIGSIWIAWDQGEKLLKATGGWSGLVAGLKSFASGEGMFAGVDEYLNEQARERAAKAEEARSGVPQSEMLGTGTRVGSGATRVGRTVPNAPAPVLRIPGGGTSRSVTLIDQRSTSIEVGGSPAPGATARAVGSAVAREQRTNLGALKGALMGASRG